MNAPKFNRSLYVKHDKIAKEISQGFFISKGYKIIDDGEHYCDYDYAIQKDKIYYVEVEQKACWYGTTFPFTTMDVPARKATSKADIFIQINNLGNALNICPMINVLTAEKYRKNTKYSSNEVFFAVKPDKFNTFIFIEGFWCTKNQSAIKNMITFEDAELNLQEPCNKISQDVQ